MSAPMVRAILSGAKTQTRRVLKSEHAEDAAIWADCRDGRWESGIASGAPGSFGHGDFVRCPYGIVGDRLWVREAIVCTSINKRPPPYDDDVATAVYAADDQPCPLDRWPWQRFRLPSIHMPYGLRRITLEVTEVRVQRLQEIDGEDAAAEGIAVPRCGCEVCSRSIAMCPADASAHVEEFAHLWDSINGKRAPWASDPWVWAITFRRLP